ncbi:MAG: hypothetical protein ACK4Q5_03825 [Saprospiraceae bacterium]
MPLLLTTGQKYFQPKRPEPAPERFSEILPTWVVFEIPASMDARRRYLPQPPLPKQNVAATDTSRTNTSRPTLPKWVVFRKK